jgi:hypothetical protein
MQVPALHSGARLVQSESDAHSTQAPLLQTGVAPEQVVQAAPPAPHALALAAVTQDVPLQHPFAQVAAEQVGPAFWHVPP